MFLIYFYLIYLINLYSYFLPGIPAFITHVLQVENDIKNVLNRIQREKSITKSFRNLINDNVNTDISSSNI